MALLTGSKVSQSQPGSGCGRTDAGVEFIHLYEREDQVTEAIVVPTLRVVAHAFEPTSPGRLIQRGCPI